MCPPPLGSREHRGHALVPAPSHGRPLPHSFCRCPLLQLAPPWSLPQAGFAVLAAPAPCVSHNSWRSLRRHFGLSGRGTPTPWKPQPRVQAALHGSRGAARSGSRSSWVQPGNAALAFSPSGSQVWACCGGPWCCPGLEVGSRLAGR